MFYAVEAFSEHPHQFAEVGYAVCSAAFSLYSQTTDRTEHQLNSAEATECIVTDAENSPAWLLLGI